MIWAIKKCVLQSLKFSCVSSMVFLHWNLEQRLNYSWLPDVWKEDRLARVPEKISSIIHCNLVFVNRFFQFHKFVVFHPLCRFFFCGSEQFNPKTFFFSSRSRADLLLRMFFFFNIHKENFQEKCWGRDWTKIALHCIQESNPPEIWKVPVPK